MRKLLFTFLIVLAFSAFQLTAGTICPAVSPDPGITDPSGCNEIITFDTTGNPTIAVVDTHPYEQSDDQLVGVVNNSSSAVTTISLSGAGIFGFEADGICSGAFIASSFCTSKDSTGYGPNGVTFSKTDASDGSVNFSPGITGGGGTGFFSLENAPGVTGSITVGGAVPEPNTVGLLGAALVGLVAVVRKRRAA